MEKNNQHSQPLLLRMSTQSEPERKPPNLLTRLSTPPLRKRKRELSSESNERWKSSGRDSTPDSKRPRVSPTNWANGQERQTRRRGRHLIPTLLRSTPSLLSRMRTDLRLEEPLPLLERLTEPTNAPLGGESEKRSKTSWIKFPEENLKGMTTSQGSHGSEREKTRCHGLVLPSTHPEGLAASKPVGLSSSSAKTYQESSPSYELPTTSPRVSLQLNGTEFFEVSPSTSTKSSRPCTLSSLMKRERAAWEELKSYLPWQNLNDKSSLALNGHQLSDECRKQSLSFSHQQNTLLLGNTFLYLTTL